MSQVFEELRRRKVFRVAAAYLVASWVLLQVADLLVPILSLPDWATRLVFFLLAIGFIPALILAWSFELHPEGLRFEQGSTHAHKNIETRPNLTVIVSLVLVLLLFGGAAGYWYFTADERWAKETALPQIDRYADAGQWEQAFALAKEVDRRLPGSPDLADVWTTIAHVTSIESTPSGATVFRRPYGEPNAEWEPLGHTPISDTKIPFGLSIVRLELEGRPPIVRVIGGESAGSARLNVSDSPNTGGASIAPGAFIFDTNETLPEGMVRVPGHSFSINGESIEVPDFFIGRYEVTNREFKQFVDDGGYSDLRFWQHEFIEDNTVIDRETALSLFVDRSGRPGPQNWVGGSYPDGRDDYPVTGISWYEAAAFAKYAGRELPTVHHWRRAHAAGMIEWQIAFSNIEHEQAAPVGEYAGMGWTGTYDMLGNAREWCFNEVDGKRAIVGASYSDPSYYAHHSIYDPGATSPMDRSTTNGLRLMESTESKNLSAVLRAPLETRKAPRVGEPVGDEVFRAYRAMFDYEHRPLDASIEESTKGRHWTRHRVSYSSHRAGERLVLYLYIPDTPATSYQAVVYWPTIGPLFSESIDPQALHLDFLLRNGRAVAFPVLAGTQERRRPSFPDWASIDGRDLVIEAMKDMRRSIDYLQSRADINDEAIAFYGHSWGGRLGAIALAIEPERLKVGILNQAGLQHLAIPETSVLNYLPQVSVPVLQFNGRYDTDFDFETSARPFFELLGTDPASKKHVINGTSHYVPREIVIGETLNWLDEYLGPVSRK